VLCSGPEAGPPALPYRVWDLETLPRVTWACNASLLPRPTSDPAAAPRLLPTALHQRVPTAPHRATQGHAGSLGEREKAGREGAGPRSKPGFLCSSSVLPHPRSSAIAGQGPQTTNHRSHPSTGPGIIHSHEEGALSPS